MTTRNAYFVPGEGENGAWRSQKLTGSQVELLTNPGDLSQSSWTKTNATVSNGGAANQRILEAASSGPHAVTQVLTKAASVKTYKVSVQVRNGLGRDLIRVAFLNNGESAVASTVFDLRDGSRGATIEGGMTIVSAAAQDDSDGFKRLQLVVQSDNTTQLKVQLQVGESASSFSYLGVITKGLEVRNLSAVVLA